MIHWLSSEKWALLLDNEGSETNKQGFNNFKLECRNQGNDFEKQYYIIITFLIFKVKDRKKNSKHLRSYFCQKNFVKRNYIDKCNDLPDENMSHVASPQTEINY